jgi:hypothetical protein
MRMIPLIFIDYLFFLRKYWYFPVQVKSRNLQIHRAQQTTIRKIIKEITYAHYTQDKMKINILKDSQRNYTSHMHTKHMLYH